MIGGVATHQKPAQLRPRVPLDGYGPMKSHIRWACANTRKPAVAKKEPQSFNNDEAKKARKKSDGLTYYMQMKIPIPQ